MNNLTLDEIAQRISDVVLGEKFLNKKSLQSKIRPILSIWIKKADKTKKYRGKTTPESKLQWTIEKEKITSKFWLNTLRAEIGEENVKKYYKKQQELLKSEGYDKNM